jgi:hypothetical protein
MLPARSAHTMFSDGIRLYVHASTNSAHDLA